MRRSTQLGLALLALASCQTEPLFAPDQQTPYSLVTYGGNLYWLTGDGAIRRTPSQGGAIETLFQDRDASHRSLVVTAEGAFWTARTKAGPGSVRRLEPGGAAPVDLHVGGLPDRLAVAGGAVFFTDGAAATLLRTTTSGGAAQLLWSDGTGYTPRQVAADSSQLFWTDATQSPSSSQYGSLFGAAPDGQDQRSLLTLEDPVALVLDDRHLYFAASRKIRRIDLTSGAIDLVVDQVRPCALALDATHVYWTVDSWPTGGLIARAPKGGGAATVITVDNDRPCSIVVDDKYIFWADQGDPSKRGSGARIVRTDKLGLP